MHRDLTSGALRAAALVALVGGGLALGGCTLASEPVPAGPIQTGPLPGEAVETAEAAPVEGVPAEEEAAVEGEVPAEEAAGEQAADTVTGRVTNATGGAEVPAEIEVQLHGLQLGPDGNIVEFMAATALTDGEGSFRFEDLPFDLENSAYVVNVIYDGVEFANGAAIDPQNPALNLPVTIFEATTDPDVIAVDAMHVIVREHPDALLVMQFYVFSNASDRVFVTEQPVSGGRRGSVAVQLPPDARNVLFEEGQLGGRFIEMGDRIVDTAVMLPGDQSQAIFVTYFLDFDGSREITLPLVYQTRSVNVLVEKGAQVRSEQLSPAGSQVFDGQAYDQFVGQDFAAGDSVAFRLRTGGPGRRSIALGIGVALAVLVAGGVVYWLVRGRGADEYLPVAGLGSAGEALVRQMAELDETFQAGRINRFEYEAGRAELKAKLAESLEEGT